MGYTAPEVIDTNNYNERCDIFSLGMVAMDLFCIDKTIVEEMHKKR